MKMVRKQFYITEEQDAALKRLAASMAVTEAEVVRMALDRLDDVTYVQNRTEDGVRVRETAVMDRYTTDEKETADVMGSNLGWRLDAQAWQEEVAFMRSLAGSKDAGGREGTTNRFNRDEIYEERLAKILRRH